MSNSDMYVQTVSYYCYTSSSDGSGSITIKGASTEHKYDLDAEAIHEIKVMCDGLIRRKRYEAAEQLRTMEVLPQISYQDKQDAVEGEYTKTADVDDDIPY